MADFSTLSDSDKQAIANKDINALSPEGLAFLKANYPPTENQEASAADRFVYAFKGAKTDVGNAATYLESEFPLGRLTFSFSNGIDYISPEELYGTQFMKASPQTRRNVLNKVREQRLAAAYPEAAQAEPGVAGIIGSIFGSFITPTTLIPISKAYQGYKGLAAIGAAYGAEYSILEQLAKKGEIDPVTVAGAAGIGAIAAPATSAVIKALTPASRKALIEKSNSEKYKQANESFETIQDAVYDIRASGFEGTIDDLKIQVKNKTGFTDEQIDDILIKSDSKLRDPSVASARDIISQRSALANPMASSGLSRSAEDLLGVVSTNIERISKNAHAALIKHDYQVAQETTNYTNKVKPFYDLVNKASRSDKKVLNGMMLDGDYAGMETVLSRYSPDAKDAITSVRSVLDEIAVRLKDEAGYTGFEAIENYFPRIVKDYDALVKSIGRERRTLLDNALKLRAKELNLNKVSELPELDRVGITNAVLRGYKYNLVDGRLRFVKQRTIDNVLPGMQKFYQDSLSALNIYINRATTDINKRKFFGRNNNKKVLALKDSNLNESIGAYIDDAIKAGEMSKYDVDRLQDLLSVRFGAGEMSANKFIQGLRNIGYSTTIGNPLSALTQIGDVGMSVYMNGFQNTLGALLGKKSFNVNDIGISDIVASELSSVGKTAKFLDKTLGLAQFKRIDKLGKNTFINAAYKKFSNMAKSQQGIQQLNKKYGKLFGDELGSLANDLRTGNISDNVKLLLYADLSGVQPISLSQMPVEYLKNPNGRILYMLKTFAIKQLDVLRRNVVHEYKAGNKLEAGKNAVAYLTIMPLIGASVQETKDFLLGRGANPEDIIKDGYIDNLFKVFGASEYVMDRFVKPGTIASAAGEMIAPPLDWIDAIGSDVAKALKGDLVAEESKAMRQVPVIGRIWYNFIGGGLEEYLKKQD